jgi:hypothetical protein
MLNAFSMGQGSFRSLWSRQPAFARRCPRRMAVWRRFVSIVMGNEEYELRTEGFPRVTSAS